MASNRVDTVTTRQALRDVSEDLRVVPMSDDQDHEDPNRKPGCKPVFLVLPAHECGYLTSQAHAILPRKFSASPARIPKRPANR